MPWLAFGILAALALGAGLIRALQAWHLGLPPCPLKAHLGIPCATCGLTRCLAALLEGRWAEAFHWHPAGAALILLSPLGVIWDFRRAWRDAPYPSWPDAPALRLGVAGLVAAAWALQIVRGI